jgi:hypothetical protein
MATATKTARTVVASASLSASTSTSGTWNGTTALGATLTLRILNGATGPTVAPTITVKTSNDNSTWRLLTTINGTTGNNDDDQYTVTIDPSVMYVQVTFTQGASGQSVTVEALIQEMTSIG